MLFREANGTIRLPGRTTRTFTDPIIPGSGALPTNWTTAAGTLSVASGWSGTSIGRATVTTAAATNGSVAAVKAAGALNTITPGNFTALMLTLESFSCDADTGMDLEIGFQGISNKGGATYQHLSGATTAIVRTKDASTVVTDLAINTAFFQGSGGGRYRRNLSFLLLPRGYVGGTTANAPYAYILEDDQVVAEAALPNFDPTQSVCPIFDVTVRDAVAHSFSWAQTKLVFNHN